MKMAPSVCGAFLGSPVRTKAMQCEPPAADDLPLTRKVSATEVADGKREKMMDLQRDN